MPPAVKQPKQPPHLSFPRRLRVGAKHYDVELADPGKDNNSGETDSQWCRIKIDPDQAPLQFVDTYLHEALHALVAESGLHTLLENPPKKYDDMEETVIRDLSTSLLALFRDNPRVLNYLKRNLKT